MGGIAERSVLANGDGRVMVECADCGTPVYAIAPMSRHSCYRRALLVAVGYIVRYIRSTRAGVLTRNSPYWYVTEAGGAATGRGRVCGD